MRLLPAIVVFLAALTSEAVPARGLVVIVNPASGVENLSRDDAVNIFMGRYRKLPSGIVAFPIDLAAPSPLRQRFYHLLVGKDTTEVDAYWAQLVFSGQTSPPMQVPDEKTAVELVAANRSAIAYVDSGKVTAKVKVVLELDNP